MRNARGFARQSIIYLRRLPFRVRFFVQTAGTVDDVLT